MVILEQKPRRKEVNIVAHAFDCLPGHVTISARGSASSLRVACCKALDALFRSPQLHRKHISDFKISVVVMK